MKKQRRVNIDMAWLEISATEMIKTDWKTRYGITLTTNEVLESQADTLYFARLVLGIAARQLLDDLIAGLTAIGSKLLPAKL